MKKTALYFFCSLQLFVISYARQDIQKKSISESIKLTKTNDILNLKDFTKSNSGPLYKTNKKGTGSVPCIGEMVTVHYTGWLLDGDKVGKKFDSSKDRGQPFQFQLGAGRVIKGWEITLADMIVGEHRLVILPPSLAYGAHGAGGAIPPNATLLFEIELLDSK